MTIEADITVNKQENVLKSRWLAFMINDSLLRQVIQFSKTVLHHRFPPKPRITSYALEVLAVQFQHIMEPGKILINFIFVIIKEKR